jgi:hypothetical protein
VRTAGTAFLGTCGGMAATHAESDGERDDNAVVPLSCSLYGTSATVHPVPGTRFAQWVAEPFDGMHFCNYAPSPASIAALERAGTTRSMSSACSSRTSALWKARRSTRSSTR